MNGKASTTRMPSNHLFLIGRDTLTTPHCRMDLYFWYDSAFGSPVARVQGIGYVQELVARLTHTPIPVHNSSTNATLDDNPATFPLGQSLYVDATHEVVVLNGKLLRIAPMPESHTEVLNSDHRTQPDELRRGRAPPCRPHPRAPRLQVLTPRALRHQHPVPTYVSPPPLPFYPILTPSPQSSPANRSPTRKSASSSTTASCP